MKTEEHIIETQKMQEKPSFPFPQKKKLCPFKIKFWILFQFFTKQNLFLRIVLFAEILFIYSLQVLWYKKTKRRREFFVNIVFFTFKFVKNQKHSKIKSDTFCFIWTRSNILIATKKFHFTSNRKRKQYFGKSTTSLFK